MKNYFVLEEYDGEYLIAEKDGLTVPIKFIFKDGSYDNWNTQWQFVLEELLSKNPEIVEILKTKYSNKMVSQNNLGAFQID